MSRFDVAPKAKPGTNSAADAFAAGADTSPPTPPPDVAPVATVALPNATPAPPASSVARHFTLRLPPVLSAKLESAFAASLRGEFNSRQDMLLRMVDRGLTDYLAGKARP